MRLLPSSSVLLIEHLFLSLFCTRLWCITKINTLSNNECKKRHLILKILNIKLLLDVLCWIYIIVKEIITTGMVNRRRSTGIPGPSGQAGWWQIKVPDGEAKKRQVVTKRGGGWWQKVPPDGDKKRRRMVTKRGAPRWRKGLPDDNKKQRRNMAKNAKKSRQNDYFRLLLKNKSKNLVANWLVNLLYKNFCKEILYFITQR